MNLADTSTLVAIGTGVVTTAITVDTWRRQRRKDAEADTMARAAVARGRAGVQRPGAVYGAAPPTAPIPMAHPPVSTAPAWPAPRGTAPGSPAPRGTAPGAGVAGTAPAALPVGPGRRNGMAMGLLTFSVLVWVVDLTVGLAAGTGDFKIDTRQKGTAGFWAGEILAGMAWIAIAVAVLSILDLTVRHRHRPVRVRIALWVSLLSICASGLIISEFD